MFIEHYVTGYELHALHTQPHLCLIATLWVRSCCCCCFTDEKTDAGKLGGQMAGMGLNAWAQGRILPFQLSCDIRVKPPHGRAQMMAFGAIGLG